MMENVWLSIIIPIYNTRREDLCRCMKSMQNSKIPMEILLIDDGSTNGIEKVCKEIAGQDDRVKYFCQGNGGVASARNYGMKLARGKYLLFLDSDDELFGFSELRDLQLYSDDWILFDYILDNGRQSRIRRQLVESEGLIELDTVVKTSIETNNLCECWGKLYRREFLVLNEITFPVGIIQGEDFIFNLQVMYYAERIRRVDACIYLYYMDLERQQKRMASDLSRQKESMALIRTWQRRLIQDKCQAEHQEYFMRLLFEKAWNDIGSLIVTAYRYISPDRKDKEFFLNWYRELKKLYSIPIRQVRSLRAWIYIILLSVQFWSGFRLLAFIKNIQQ